MSSHSVTSPADDNGVEETLDAHTTILRWIAGLLTAGAAWMLAPILVPFVLALALAIALSPLARRIERMGVGRTGSSLVCLVLVAGTLMLTAGLLAYQAGTILQQSDRYLDRLSRLLATATKSVGGERLLISLGAIRASEESSGPHGANPDGETDAAAATGDGADQRGGMSKPARLDPVAFLKQLLRSNLRLVGGWLVTGIGGIVGLIGSAVICLSFVFYLLQTRSEWIDRLLRVLYFLGLRPRRDNLERVQSTITVFGGFVVMVSICGAAVIGTTAWLIGLPQPYLWGLIFGLLEFVPYFGPMVGGTLLTLVALTTGEGSWWQRGDDAHRDPRLADPGGLCHSTDGLRASCPVRPCHGSRCNLVLWLVVGAAGDGHGAACHGHAAGAGDHVSREPRTRCSDGTPAVGNDRARVALAPRPMEADAWRCGSKTTLSLATARRRPWWRGTDRSTGFAYPVSIRAHASPPFWAPRSTADG